MLNSLHGIAERFSGPAPPPAADAPLYAILAPIADGINDGHPLVPFLRMLDQTRGPLFGFFESRVTSASAARALTVKVLNLCLARYHFVTRGTTVLSLPLGLVVDPINNCNLACPGCVHSTRARALDLFEWNSGMLSEQRFAALLARYGPSAIEIMLCNYGEPLLNPKTPAFIRLAKTYLMRTALSTNMTAPRFDATAYVNSGLDFITLSIDGATQSVYEQYRRKGDIEVAFRNIRSLVAARRESGRGTPVISWQYLAFDHNANEIDLAREMARSLGVDQFTVAEPFDVSWDEPGIRPATGVEHGTVLFRPDSELRMIENWNPFPSDLRTTEIDHVFEAGWASQVDLQPREFHVLNARAEHTCHWLYRNMVLDANGRVIPCCAAPKASADLVFAAFDGASSEESFNSAKYRLARLSFADREAYSRERGSAILSGEPHCAKCEWDQTRSHTDGAQVEQYFKTAGQSLFDDRSLQLLGGW